MRRHRVDVLAALVLGAAVVPYTDAGASDALYTDERACRPVASAELRSASMIRAHGRDERVGVVRFHSGNVFFYRDLKLVTSA